LGRLCVVEGLLQIQRRGDDVIETGHGQRWPEEPRGTIYYEALAGEVGLKISSVDQIGSVFYLQLVKE